MRIAVVALTMLVSVASSCQSRQCKGNPKVLGACYVVHGRATYGPGTPALRIWPVGTKRMLGVTAGPIADDADDPIVPKEMMRFTTNVEAIFGDYEVCPFAPEQKGHMQMVCVQSVKNVFVKRFADKQR